MDSIKDILDKKSIKPVGRMEEFVTVVSTPSSENREPLKFTDLLLKDLGEDEWVAERLIPMGLTVMSAQPASYKTWLLLHIAISVASGRKMFNHIETTQSGVLIIDEENSERLLQKRIKLLTNETDLPIYFMVENAFKADDKHINKVIKFCRKQGIRLITIDSLVRIHSGNENDAVQMSEMFLKVRRFTQAGISVLITHHNRKGSPGSQGGSQEMRGSSDILASVDCHLAVSRERSSRQLVISQTKVRATEELPPIEVEVKSDDEQFMFTYSGSLEPVISIKTKLRNSILKVLSASENPLNQKNIAQALMPDFKTVNMKTLRGVIKKLVSDGALNEQNGNGRELLYSLKSKKVNP